MNDDQLFLANAYVDGELTDDERVLAEADPAVMAEVDELRALQAQLRDVEPPDDAARESAIAAAMAEFTNRAAVSTATSPTSPTPPLAASSPAPSAAPPTADAGSSTVVPLHRRSWFRPAMSIAAATVGVGLFAVVIGRGGTGSNDDDAAEPAAQEVTAESADEALGQFETADEAADEPAAEPADEPAMAEEDAGADMAADDEMAEEEPAEEAATESAEEPADEPTADDRGIPIDLAVLPGGALDNPIVDEIELTIYATGLIRNRDLGALPPSPNHACPDAFNVVASGFVLVEGVVVDALIDLAPDDTLVTAWSLDDAPVPCSVLLEAPMPTPDS